MPRYDYECQSCHLVFEVKQSFSSEPVATCPNCANGARRVIHSVPVVFKGSGFYVNDYGKGTRSPSPGPQSEESDSKKDSKSEGKAKAKSEPKAEAGSTAGGSKKEAKAAE